MPTDLKVLGIRQVLALLGVGHVGGGFTILGENLHRMKTWLCERIVANACDSSRFYAHRKTTKFQKDNVMEARLVLEEMWSPIRGFN